MLDKKHDGFFDEDTSENRKSDELMKMIELGGHDKQMKSFSVGDKVSGTVSRISADSLFVDIGAKNEAVMKMSDTDADVKAGDTVSGFIVSKSGGETVISKSMAAAVGGVDMLRDALNARLPVQGKVTGVSKSGLTVKIMGHRAFCPVSQIDVKFTSDVNEYLGKTLDFVITRITEGGKNIVVSRVPLFEASLEEQFKKFADAAGSDKVFTGTISKILEFGLFVELGGLEGLVHISEVSWERAQNLNDSFSMGQTVEFVVLKAERKDSLRNSKISMSIKQALEDPWKRVTEQVNVGQSIEGRVTRLADFGAFVEVMPGVEGLVHISEMAWGRRVYHPSEIVKPGQTIKVTVLGIDLNKRSISLTLKDVANDPWSGIEEKLSVGADVEGTVARKAKFGYFVDLFEGVTGLLVFSRMAPDKKDSLKPGDTVTVQVESIDTDSRRVSLSMGGVSDSGKETSDTREYLKKQNAKSDKKQSSAPTDTEFGTALMAALKMTKPEDEKPSAQTSAAKSLKPEPEDEEPAVETKSPKPAKKKSTAKTAASESPMQPVVSELSPAPVAADDASAETAAQAD
ncbi:MAG: S1 RNA-binding domain-containing protein [Chitinispirillales bacterium]|jgi:small subunit ribosomal protein S1|nr:S1 RNA-binding domain-containing protein [Chitinispirillales bacterium]